MSDFLSISSTIQTPITLKPSPSITTLPINKNYSKKNKNTNPNFPTLQVSGNNYFYIFDKPGAYSISFNMNTSVTDVSYLVVGGGGGSSGTYGANGGNIQYGTLSKISNNTYTLVVGKGGQGSNSGDYSSITLSSINPSTPSTPSTSQTQPIYAEGGKGTSQIEDLTNNKYSKGGDGCNGIYISTNGDTQGSTIKYTVVPGIAEYSLKYIAGIGGLGSSSSYFDGLNIGIGGIKYAGGGGGPVHMDTNTNTIINGIGNDGGGTNGSVKATYGGGGSGYITPPVSTNNTSNGGHGVIVIQYTIEGDIQNIAAPGNFVGCGIGKGCGTILGFTDQYSLANTMESIESFDSMIPTTRGPSASWLPFPVDDETCQHCTDIYNKNPQDLYSLIKSKISKDPSPTINNSLINLFFDINNHSIKVTDTDNNVYTYKPLPQNLLKSIHYTGDDMTINMNPPTISPTIMSLNNIVWTRKLDTAISSTDDQGNQVQNNPSTGTYNFDYQVINNNNTQILVYYDCSAPHTDRNYYMPSITQDASGNYKLKFDKTSSKISANQQHIHVKQQNIDYHGYTPTAIMDFFIRSYPDIALNIHNLPSKLQNDPFYKINPQLTPDVLAADDVVTLISQYYFALCQEKKKIDYYNQVVSTNIASKPLYETTIEDYNNTYINVLNMSAGIVAALAFVYILTTNTK